MYKENGRGRSLFAYVGNSSRHICRAGNARPYILNMVRVVGACKAMDDGIGKYGLKNGTKKVAKDCGIDIFAKNCDNVAEMAKVH